MTPRADRDEADQRTACAQIRAAGQRGEFRAAADAADRALHRWPGSDELHLLRALMAERLSQWELVLSHAEAFERLAPDRDPMDISAGWALLQLGRPEDARRRLEQAVERFPENATAWMNLGIAAKRLGDAERAITCQQRAAELAPALPQPWLNIASTLQDCGRPEYALAALETLRTRVGTIAEAESFRAFLTLCVPSSNPLDHRRAAERAALAVEAAAQAFGGPARFRNDRKRNRRLRVGFFSGDFRDHSVASFALPLIESLDRSTIEPLLFSSTPTPDAVTERFRRAAPLFDVYGLAPKAVLESGRGKQLDIAIDLAGHSSGHSLAAFAGRIAPVQVTWLGYAGTTGLRAMDARLVDSITDPPGSAAACSERLVSLDPCFLCWRSREEVDLPAGTRSDGDPIVFGSFNDLAKLSDPAVERWAEILRREPRGRLLLKNYSLRFATVRDAIRARFARQGIAPERIETVAWVPTTAAHLALYGRVDVALDSFPYNGTTTTCEALWMGTPVVTLEGPAHHARVGSTILRAIGRPDLVAETTQAYVDRAVALATELAAGAGHGGRAALRAAMQASPLRNEAGFARRFEAALRGLWHAWCERTVGVG